MKSMQKMKALKGALALAVALAMTGTGWAKKNGGVPGIPGDLNSTRDSVTLSVPVVCDDLTITDGYTVKATIFQPSGRLLAIGMGTSDPFTCDPTVNQPVEVMVDAVPGLTFKPGPATLVYQVILTDTNVTPPTPPTVIVEREMGSRVDLH